MDRSTEASGCICADYRHTVGRERVGIVLNHTGFKLTGDVFLAHEGYSPLFEIFLKVREARGRGIHKDSHCVVAVKEAVYFFDL